MVSGDCSGNVILWDLENKKILFKFQQCFEEEVDSLLFMPGMPVVACGSSKANGLRQLRVNLEDSKILTLLRERVGCTTPFEKIVVGDNNQLVLSTESKSIFMAFHSQCNNYLLPKTLHSQLPYHLVARHFNVELWKERTVEKTYKLHQYALLGKISLSRRFYVVATASRVVKLGGSSQLEWKIAGVKHLFLYNEHSIFAFTDFEMIVLDFNTSTIVERVAKRSVNAPSLNVFGNLITFYESEQRCVEVWDMMKIIQGRAFSLKDQKDVLALSFTADNKFLISTHVGGALIIWSIVEGELYKQYILPQQITVHCFTVDNQFMLSVFKGGKEVNIWNNYLGRLSSSRQEEALDFVPEVREVGEDYRKELVEFKGRSVETQQGEDGDVLDTIADAEDELPEYGFEDINKWMPLVFYDEIKARNTPEMKTEVQSLPFFLDFKNLTEEKQKIEEAFRKETMQKKKDYKEEKDKHLKGETNAILLNLESAEADFIDTYKKLNKLSVAEVDYQLRSFLLTPGNAPILLKLVIAGMGKEVEVKQEIKNIITNRVINLIGSDLLTTDCLPVAAELSMLVNASLDQMKQKVDRCVTISDHNMK